MIKSLVKKILPNAYIAERSIRHWYIAKREQVQTVDTAICQIERRWKIQQAESSDSPIFIFSAEWRSGSTLLQRLINSDRRVLIWGEPFHKGNFVQTLSDSLRSFSAIEPSDDHFVDSSNFSDSQSEFSRRWTANLYPPIQSLLEAQTAFFNTLYAQPAIDRGFERWGFKEVRLTIEHAYYLKWLYPKAKFLFLYRNPYKCYQSCHTWRDLYLRWPDSPVPTTEVFGRTWVDMVKGFQAGYKAVDGLLIRYEDFCEGTPSTDELANYLNLDLDAAVLTKRIGSQKAKSPLTIQQIKRLKKVVDPLATELGYTGLTT